MVNGAEDTNFLKELILDWELSKLSTNLARSLMAPLSGNTRFLAIMLSAMIFVLIFDNTVFAQLSPFSSSTKSAIKIVSPENGESKSTGEPLLVNGTSSDTEQTNCNVQIIVNNVKPYQNANPTGPGGNTDYSKWTFLLSSNYTSLKEGLNKLTAKLDCPNALPSGMTKWFSVNVTGIQ